jgi:hypothetical protein
MDSSTAIGEDRGLRFALAKSGELSAAQRVSIAVPVDSE